eukprot:m.367223 g.367223  ORF g.367223 m.367223 type:complete len:74 (+) comp39609_c0_seq1:320-541(+)
MQSSRKVPLWSKPFGQTECVVRREDASPECVPHAPQATHSCPTATAYGVGVATTSLPLKDQSPQLSRDLYEFV